MKNLFFNRIADKLIGFFIALSCLIMVGALCLLYFPIESTENIMTSEHFNGKYYSNREMASRPFWHVFYWMLTRNPAKWPDSVPVQQQKIEKERVGSNEVVVTFVNHSTVLIQINGWNILTDPIWSERASPFTWIGPKRVALPGVKFEDLPPIDMVLISHNHYDHMDLPTLRRLEKEHQPVFYVPIGNKALLDSEGFSHVNQMDWWEEIAFSIDHQLVFVPSRHFSSRKLTDRNRTLWGSFVIRGPKHRIYFAGDTGYGTHFKQINERLGPPTLSILPIGAYKPKWFMQPVHLCPQEALQAHLDLNSRQSLAIHFGTFQLTDEGIDEPIEELRKAMQDRQVSFEKFWVLKNGESKKIN